MAYDISVRTLEEDVFDGTTGAKIDTTTTYQLGATIDGVFFPFISKQGGYVDAYVAREKANQPAQSQDQTAQPSTEPTPAPQAQPESTV